MERKYAIIDLGSNSVRMIIMKVYEDYSYKMIDEVKEMVRLSEGMGEELTLKPRAIGRTINALKLFKKLIEVHQPYKIYLMATAAVRNAANQQMFLDKVKTETGFDFTVLSGEKEAFYGYLGVINSIDIENCMIIDVGGASTELVWVENRKLKEAVSFPFGSVILSERFLEKDEISSSKLKKLEEFIGKKFKEVPWLNKCNTLPVVGLGGTARTLAKIDKNKIGFPLVSLHNYQMTYREVASAYGKVIKANYSQRKNIPGVNKDRADIIVGGMVPIKALMNYIKAEKLIVSGNGLREGVFYETYLQEYYQNSQLLEDVLFHSVHNTLKNYDVNLKHSYHVQKLALSIFDQTQKIHGLGNNERKLLSVGALLHDIGNYVEYYNHHKHGFYLVLNSRLNGLRNRELVMCAFIVALHRDMEYKRDWKEFQMLINKNDYEIINKLSVFVNIAERLDRTEYGSVEDVECFIEGDTLQIMLKSSVSPELEIAATSKCQRAFKRLFNKKLLVV